MPNQLSKIVEERIVAFALPARLHRRRRLDRGPRGGGAVGRFIVIANGPEHDAGLRVALPTWDDVTVTEVSIGADFYEAVVSTFVEQR